MDWNGLFEDYMCANPRSRFIPDKSIDSIIEFETVPRAYTVSFINFTHKVL